MHDLQRFVQSLLVNHTVTLCVHFNTSPPSWEKLLHFFVSSLSTFIVNGALKVIQKWLSNGMKESVHEMAELCSTLLYKGLSGFSI